MVYICLSTILGWVLQLFTLLYSVYCFCLDDDYYIRRLACSDIVKVVFVTWHLAESIVL